jgi:uncharacterized membrane protein
MKILILVILIVFIFCFICFLESNSKKYQRVKEMPIYNLTEKVAKKSTYSKKFNDKLNKKRLELITKKNI